MAIEIQENRVRRVPLIFSVPGCGLVVAARTLFSGRGVDRTGDKLGTKGLTLRGVTQ
jgi:hypothetical protein